MTTTQPDSVAQKHNAIARELEEIEALGLRRRPKLIEGPVGPRVSIDGRQILLLCSNDYLGLSSHPGVRRAAKAAVDEVVRRRVARLVMDRIGAYRAVNVRSCVSISNFLQYFYVYAK